MHAATRTDLILSKVVHFTEQIWPLAVTDCMHPIKSRQQELTLEGGCLLWGNRVFIPAKLRARVLQELHCAHSKVSLMKAVAQSYFWWRGLDKDIKELAKWCTSVNLSSLIHLQHHSTHAWIWPTKPWQWVHLDFAAPFFRKHSLMLCMHIPNGRRWQRCAVYLQREPSLLWGIWLLPMVY